MHVFIKTMFVGMVALLSDITFAASAHAQVIFSDNFTLSNGSADANWTISSGTWAVNNGRYSSGTHSAATPITASFANTAALTDFNVNTDIIGSQDGGFLLRAQDANNLIALIVRPNFSDAYWHVRQGGNWGSILNPITLGFAAQSNLHVGINVVGSQYTAIISNGTTSQTLALNSSTYTTGKVGLYNFGSSESFDNFVITSTPEPGSLALLMTAVLAGVGFRRRRRKSLPR